MTNLSTFLEAAKLSREIIHSYAFKCDARLAPEFFSRERKMEFTSVVMFILSFAKKSLQLELDNFFKMLNNKEAESITKQAYSAARRKICPTAFVHLLNAVVEMYYSTFDFARFKGYRLLAIDGSIMEIPNTAVLRDAYGFAANQTSKVARAKGSVLYDLENNLIIDARIARYNDAERDLALQHLEHLQTIRTQKELVLFDRGYPGCELIEYLIYHKIDFLMRTPSNFLKEIRDAKGEDSVVEYKFNKKRFRIRVIKVLLSTGEEEVLISSLFNSEFTAEDFKNLYFRRWGVEVKYDELKNKLQIENFTGECKIAIEQDFYASMYLSNMVSLAKMEAEEKLAETEKTTKYAYKVNVNILIGKLKDNLVLMMLEEDPEKRTKMFQQTMKEIVRNIVPIRPNRTQPRKKRYSEEKYPRNRKSCL